MTNHPTVSDCYTYKRAHNNTILWATRLGDAPKTRKLTRAVLESYNYPLVCTKHVTLPCPGELCCKHQMVDSFSLFYIHSRHEKQYAPHCDAYGRWTSRVSVGMISSSTDSIAYIWNACSPCYRHELCIDSRHLLVRNRLNTLRSPSDNFRVGPRQWKCRARDNQSSLWLAPGELNTETQQQQQQTPH